MDDDDGNWILWVALGAAVIYFLSSKFGNTASAASVPALPAPAAPVSSSSAVSAAASAGATADEIANFDPTQNVY